MRAARTLESLVQQQFHEACHEFLLLEDLCFYQTGASPLTRGQQMWDSAVPVVAEAVEAWRATKPAGLTVLHLRNDPHQVLEWKWV